MTWINQQGQLYEGDLQPGDREATDAEIIPIKKLSALLALASDYKSDLSSLNTSWLAASVSDGDQETVKKAAIIQAVTDRKTQYTADVAAVRALYPTT